MRHRTALRRAVLAVGLALGTAAATPASANDRALTDALIWTGVSSRVARGRLDGRDRTAIRLAEDRIGGYPDGHLDGGERRAVMAAARHAREREGYRVLTDPATGARVGVPTAWVARRADAPGGSRWRSPDGAIDVRTFRRSGSLVGLERAERRRGVDVTYAAGRGSWRVVSGFAPGRRTVYTRAVERGGEVSGFRVTYETALGPRLDRVAVAMSSDFRAFAGPASVDALAYAPADERHDERFEAIERPRYAVLPERGPEPIARPEREVASLDAPALDRVRDGRNGDPAPSIDDGATRITPGPEGAAPVEPEPVGPIDLLDDTEMALAPSRPVDRPVDPAQPDPGEAEPDVPQTVTGLITDEGQSCVTLRGPDGTLYALVGEVPDLAPGTFVRVEARGVDTEACSAGRTVAVGGLEVIQSP